jgi:hypothetical protein
MDWHGIGYAALAAVSAAIGVGTPPAIRGSRPEALALFTHPHTAPYAAALRTMVGHRRPAVHASRRSTRISTRPFFVVVPEETRKGHEPR